MVAPSLLAAQRTATPSAQRLTGGVTLTVASGGTYGTGESAAVATAALMGANRQVEFKGELYAATIHTGTGRIFRRTGGAWSEVHNTGAAISNGYYISGMYVVNAGGTEYLCCVMQSGANTYWLRSTNGTAWSSSVPVPGGIPFWNNNGVAYRGSLILAANQAGGAFALGIFDPVAGGLTTIAIPASAGESGNGGSGCPCVFNNRLFLVKAGDASGRATKLYEIAGGGAISRSADLNAVAMTNANPGTSHLPVLFPVGDTKMVAIVVSNEGASTYQNRAFDFVPSGSGFTLTEKTTSLLPVALRTAGAALLNTGWVVFVDTDTAPGSPAVYLWHTPAWSTGTYSYYEYVNSDTEMGPGSLVGASGTYALSCQTRGGGEYVNTTDSDLFIDSYTLAPGSAPGRVLITFKARGDVGSSDKFVRGWFSTLENTVFTQMTLVGSATGGSAARVGNEIQQVDADPANTYTFEWDALGQGVANGKICAVKLRVSHS